MVKRPAVPSTLLLIDGHAVLHRAYHALPPLTSPSGQLVNAVYGFATILLKALADFAPTHVAVVFDAGGETFRHELFAAYQAQREEKPDELYAQLDRIKALLAAFRIPVFEQEGVEADDIIGTIVQKMQNAERRTQNSAHVLILTGDKDLLQLVSDRAEVVLLRRGVSETERYDPAAVVKRFGFSPERMPDFKALAGDPSDNYPGVPGIGEKTATALVRAFGDVAGILKAARAKTRKPPLTEKLSAKLRDHAGDARLSLRLATIQRDVPLAFSFDACLRRAPNRDAAIALFRELGFSSLLGRIPAAGQGGTPSNDGAPPRAAAAPIPPPDRKKGGAAQERSSSHIEAPTTDAELRRLAADLAVSGGFTFLIAADEGSPRVAHPRAIGFAMRERVVVAEPWGSALAATATALRSDVPKTTHDAKAALHLLGRARVIPAGTCDDTMLMSYLLAPGSRSHDLQKVAFAGLGVELSEFAGVADEVRAEDRRTAPHGASSRSLLQTPHSPSTLVAHIRAIARLSPLLRKRLADEGLTRVYEEFERPLVPVLQRMEWHGIRLDADALAVLSTTMHRELDRVDANIFSHAGHEFSVDSPKQLKAVLFEELGLTARGLKKTAKGHTLSTAAAELEKLRGAHPIIPDILEHRELTKLLSTYVDALPALVDSTTGRVHTTFHQTVTATGRLSSSDPNLQNIPVSEPWGPAIRRAFIAEDGWQLLALDYSQFELRVAAALSGDRALTRAFRERQDIHAATAAEVFGVAPDVVTKDQRRVAKAINFGILYGMGAGALAQTAGISRPEAEEYISRYFAAFRELREWVEATKALAATRGFVETMFGRKRYLPEIASGVPMVRAAAERMAVNMPVQGTQADLVKRAMIRADAWIGEANRTSDVRRQTSDVRRQASGVRHQASGERIRMLLTVHDELVFEVREEFMHESARALTEILEGVEQLPVPIVVEARVGRSWGEMGNVDQLIG